MTDLYIRLGGGVEVSVGFTIFMIVYFFSSMELGQNQNTNTDILLEILTGVKQIAKMHNEVGQATTQQSVMVGAESTIISQTVEIKNET